MPVARTFLAFLIALSVAILPAAGGAAMVQKSAEISVSGPMHDCCPGQTDQAMDCASMAGCALKCFGFSGPMVSELGVPAMLARALPLPASQAVHSRAAAPPFRPPRA